MDMSAFRQHLKEVNGKLVKPQASAMYEEKKSGPSLEESIRGVASGQLNEARKQDSGGYGFKTPPVRKEGILSTGAKIVAPMVATAVLDKVTKKKPMPIPKADESVIAEYLNDYFGGTIAEDTSDDDLMEAIQNLFMVEACLLEYLENDEVDESIESQVDEYLSEYFDGQISESTTQDEIAAAVHDLFNLAEAVRKEIN